MFNSIYLIALFVPVILCIRNGEMDTRRESSFFPSESLDDGNLNSQLDGINERNLPDNNKRIRFVDDRETADDFVNVNKADEQSYPPVDGRQYYFQQENPIKYNKKPRPNYTSYPGSNNDDYDGINDVDYNYRPMKKPSRTKPKPKPQGSYYLYSQDYPQNYPGYQQSNQGYGLISDAYPSGPQKYPSYAQGYPTGQQGYPSGFQSYPNVQQDYPSGSQEYPTDSQGYPSASQGYPQSNPYDYYQQEQFNSPQLPPGSLLNLFNRPNRPNAPFGQLGNVGGQFAKALEDIAHYDDLQCVPKILCQMIGSQRGQGTLPGFINAPTLSALIAAVPSTSPSLVFGRAALLGFTVGDRSCDGAYPRCPKSEDDLLYYINNHRGGFFRFFNGGASYGDFEQIQQDQQSTGQNQQFGQNYYDQTQQSSGQLSVLQGLTDAVNQGGGINLSNLGSNLGLLGNLASLVGGNGAGSAASGNQQSQSNIGQVVGNLLTGLVGTRFTSRKKSKRSIPDVKKNVTEVEPRILHKKQEIFALVDQHDNFKFPVSASAVAYLDSFPRPEKNRPSNKIKFVDDDHYAYSIVTNNIDNFIFPVENSEKQLQFGPGVRGSKKVKFTVNDNDEDAPEPPKPLDFYDRTKMIFPDRTGTGELRFDSDYFKREIIKTGNRGGKILTGTRPQVNNNYFNNYNYDSINSDTTSANDNYSSNINYPVYPIVVNTNRYQKDKYYNSNTDYNKNRYQSLYSSANYQQPYKQQQQQDNGNVYVTNANGVTEYYITANGQKVYV